MPRPLGRSSPAGVIELQASGNADEKSAITGTSVVAKAVGTGTATVTATVDGKQYSTTLTVTDPTVKNVYVTVGGTATETETGDVTGSVDATGYDSSIASYEPKYVNTPAVPRKNLGNKITMDSDATYTGVISDGTNYLVIDSNGNVSNTTEIADATEFTVTRKTTSGWGSTTAYTIQGNGKYLDVTRSYLGLGWNYKLSTSNNSADWSYDSSSVFFKSYYLTYNNGWTVARNSGNGFLYTVKDDSTPAKNETQITFTGKSVGVTSVKIGDVTYNIIVSDKAPDDALTADTITLQHWITNARVAATSGATGDNRNVQKISKTTAGIQSEDGVAVEKLAYTPYGYWGDTKVYYWQGMKLDKNNVQTDDSGDDETADGTTLTHIRYYGNAWQYKTADETWHYFQNTDQFVIYYLQKTEVTKEVDTYVKDWGFDTKETTKDWSDGKGQVALTIAVVYPNGTVSPVESSMYSNSTIIYNYVDGRDIGIVAPKNNSDYNIAKITVTDGTRDSNRSSNVWYTYDTITWDKTTDSATGKTWYNETEVWNKSSGTTPMVNGKNSNITWAAKNTAKLVLIYLETVERETNLNVVYWDDNAGVKITGSQIAMKFTQGDTEPSFKTNLKGVTAGVTSWPSKDKSSSDYLPDTAYVTNSSGVDQTFNKDLVTVPGVTGVYTSGLYEYVSADISDDGKTLTLHYNLRQVEGKTYVLDFGLPIEIPITDFFAFENDSLKNSVTDISFESSTSVMEKQGEYGKGKIDKSTGIVTYTLTKALDSKVAIPVFVTLNDAAKTVKRLQVYVIPATSVYYEDSFATFTNANGTKNVAQGDNAAKGIWTKVTDGTTQTNVNQALEALGGTTNTKNVYGYDPAYANSSKFSMGSATKVTVAADTYKEGKTQWPTATFTFKGTGFDVISLTDNTSGTIFVTVKDKATGKVVKSSAVNNYYGYKYQGDKWVATENDPNCLYQIPVMKIAGLDYAEYEVMIQVAYASFLDEANAGSYNFWLDAIRVYDPMGKDNATYEQDNEGYPQYIKLRDELVKTGSSIDATPRTTVFIDGAAEATIDQYKNYGPNNEVYLAKGQAISFTIPENINIASIQIGAKAPNGNSAEMNVNGTKKAIPSATEMYYQIATQGKSFTVTNTGNGLLSLTNLKITFNSKPNTTVTLAALSDEDQANAVAQVRALFAAPAEPFNPDRFDASWSRNVRKGETAKLTVKTSEDVEAITVNGETIDSFTERHERTGWGWWAKTVTYREFIYTTTADVTRDYTVCAVNAAGVRSEEKTATLTVRPSVRDWLHGIFGKWF